MSGARGDDLVRLGRRLPEGLLHLVLRRSAEEEDVGERGERGGGRGEGNGIGGEGKGGG